MAFQFQRSLWQRIKDLVTGKAWQKSGGQPIYVAAGQRGGGAGSLTTDETNEFIYRGVPVIFSSSNVASAQFFIEDEVLVVEYLRYKRKNAIYMYDRVNINTAVALIQAASKGVACWDLFRGGSRATRQAVGSGRASMRRGASNRGSYRRIQ